MTVSVQVHLLAIAVWDARGMTRLRGLGKGHYTAVDSLSPKLVSVARAREHVRVWRSGIGMD